MRVFVAFIMFVMVTNYSFARDRVVKCRIDSGNQTVYNGRCMFMPDGGGSFTLGSPYKGEALTRYIEMVSVSIVGRGYADVSGLTTSGNNSRWGEARRSSRDRACWVGSDFRICAW